MTWLTRVRLWFRWYIPVSLRRTGRWHRGRWSCREWTSLEPALSSLACVAVCSPCRSARPLPASAFLSGTRCPRGQSVDNHHNHQVGKYTNSQYHCRPQDKEYSRPLLYPPPVCSASTKVRLSRSGGEYFSSYTFCNIQLGKKKYLEQKRRFIVYAGLGYNKTMVFHQNSFALQAQQNFDLCTTTHPLGKGQDVVPYITIELKWLFLCFIYYWACVCCLFTIFCFDVDCFLFISISKKHMFIQK